MFNDEMAAVVNDYSADVSIEVTFFCSREVAQKLNPSPLESGTTQTERRVRGVVNFAYITNPSTEWDHFQGELKRRPCYWIDTAQTKMAVR